MATGCPICGGETREVPNLFCETYSRLRFPGVELHHHECRSCGHGLLLHDLPLDRLYTVAMATPMDHGRDVRLDFIRAHLDLGRVAGEVIEIGGGPGELAEQARRAAGKDRAYVVDFVSRVAFPNLDFVKVDLNSEAIRLVESFDTQAAHLFLLSHLLEHLEDPAALLTQLQRFENSFVFIEVPDFGSRHSPATLQWQMNGLEHVQYFNDASLIELLHKGGFQVLAFETQAAPNMTVIRTLCAPRRISAVGIEQHNALYHLIVERFRSKILSEPPSREVWVWGLSPYMAETLAQSDEARGRISGIVDNRYPGSTFLGLTVFQEPGVAPDNRPLILCGSTYSVVRSAFLAKATKLWPDAEFFTVSLDD
jgi:hypothetical protein